MKRFQLLIAAATLCASLSASAQKNTWIVDANGGANHQSYQPGNGGNPVTLSGWSINGNIGRQLTNHFMVGILGGMGYQQAFDQFTTASGAVENVNSTIKLWHVGVYGRYTYWINNHLFLYSQLSATHYDYSVDQSTTLGAYYPISYYDYSNNPQSGTIPQGFAVNLFPAVGVNIFRGYGIHMDVGGINYVRSTPNGNMYSNINVNFGQQFHFGLHKIIGWKKMAGKPSETGILSK